MLLSTSEVVVTVKFCSEPRDLSLIMQNCHLSDYYYIGLMGLVTASSLSALVWLGEERDVATTHRKKK